MRESDGNEQLIAFLGRQLYRGVPAKGRRASADVDRHVENRALNDANQFGLREGRGLKMQASDCPGRTGQGLVVLNEAIDDPRCGEALAVKGFREEAPLITETRWCEKQNFSDGQGCDLQGFIPDSQFVDTRKTMLLKAKSYQLFYDLINADSL